MFLPGIGIDHKIKETAEGYVADFCEFCNELCVFVVGRFDWDVSVYGDSYKPAPDYNAVCTRCQFQQTTRIERYTTILKAPPVDLNQAITETLPNALEIYGGQLAVEKRLREGTASDGELLDRICDAIKFADKRSGGHELSDTSLLNTLILSGIVGVGIGFCAFFLLPLFGMDLRNARALAWFSAPVSAPIFFLVYRFVEPYRLRKWARLNLRLVGFALLPVRLSSDSMNRALLILRESHCELACWITADDIFQEIKNTREVLSQAFRDFENRQPGSL